MTIVTKGIHLHIPRRKVSKGVAPQDTNGGDGSSAPVQIATMDTQGDVIIWSLIQLETEASQEMDANADVGLAIGPSSLRSLAPLYIASD